MQIRYIKILSKASNLLVDAAAEVPVLKGDAVVEVDVVIVVITEKAQLLPQNLF